MVSTHLKNISQNGNLPPLGMNIKNMWNHQTDDMTTSQVPPAKPLPRATLPEKGNEKIPRWSWETHPYRLQWPVRRMIIYPWNLTWNLKRSPWKRRFLLETIIFRFHVKFRGSIYLEPETSIYKWLVSTGWFQMFRWEMVGCFKHPLETSCLGFQDTVRYTCKFNDLLIPLYDFIVATTGRQ